jgi:hypothetical protein
VIALRGGEWVGFDDVSYVSCRCMVEGVVEMSVGTGNFEGMDDIGDKCCLLGFGVYLIDPLIASTCGEYLRGFRCQAPL